MNAPRASHITLIGMIAATIATLTMAGILAAAPAAAPTPQAAIAARQAGYKKMGAAMKALNEQLKGDAPAKDAMAGAARTLAMTAREQARLFPAGSGQTAGIPTDALPGIWTDRATFDAQMNRLIAESGKLMAVTNGGDLNAIRAQAKATGATCAGCHRQFRADN